MPALASSVGANDLEGFLVRVVETDDAVQLLEGAGEGDSEIVIGVDVNALEEGLVESSPHQRRAMQVGRVAVPREPEGVVEGSFDVLEGQLRDVELSLGFVDLTGDAVLLGLEEVQGDSVGEVGAEEVGALGVEFLQPTGQPLVCCLGLLALPGNLGVQSGPDLLHEVVVDLDEPPPGSERCFEPVCAYVGEGAGVASVVAHALEVVVGAAVPAVAGEDEA